MKVYVVYSIPKSPEYNLKKIFINKELAKNYIKRLKNPYCNDICDWCWRKVEPSKDYENLKKHYDNCSCKCHASYRTLSTEIYDIQIEDVEE